MKNNKNMKGDRVGTKFGYKFGYNRKDALSSVGEGWSKIINNLYDAKPKSVLVIQVKEKFGGLRFYVGIAPEWYCDLIDYYEEQSLKTCEICGKEGKLRTDLSWMKTLCDEDYNKIKEQFYGNRKEDIDNVNN